MKLSIICPVLKFTDEIHLMLHSFRCFVPCNYKYEVLIITSDRDCSGISSKFPEVKIVWEEKQQGVYAAMNLGIEEAVGEYLYFIGQDDHVLRGFAKLLDKCVKSNLDYCIGAVCWGDKKVVHATRAGVKLWFDNWCHQAVIYRRGLFLKQKYKAAYSIQADHALNLYLRYNPKYRFEISPIVVAWYSAEGISSRTKDYHFWYDIPNLATLYCGVFERLIVLTLHFLISNYSKVKKWKNM